LLCLGGSSVDIILQVPRLPASDQKLVAGYVGHQAGGLVANTAAAAARLGLNVAWSGRVGGDENGRLLLDSFAKFGVDTSLSVLDHEGITDFTVILLEPSGERTILVVPTAVVPPPINQSILAALAQVGSVYTIPYALDWFSQIALAVHANAGLVFVDVEVSSPVDGVTLRNVLGYADVVFCNQRGLKLASGEKDLETGAQILLDLGLKCVCVTLGAQGAWAFTTQSRAFSPGFDVPVLDTTGAGDCFHAAFICGYLAGWPMGDMLKFANAAAALHVQQVGPRLGLPTRTQVEDFLSSN
jgi:sugar/nucleoside kinase (ribokinase family)